MLCSPLRAPATDSNIRRQWENRWRCGRWDGHRQSIGHLSGWIGSRAKAFADVMADASPIGPLGLGLSVSLKMRSQFPDDKFLKDTGDGALTKLDQAVLPHHSMAIGLRIVGIRDGAGCEGSDDFGVIELPFLIVALGNHGIAERIQNTRSSTTGSLVEITWILFQDGWQNGASDERAHKNVRVGCAEAFCITFCTLPVSAVFICRLLNSSKEANGHEGEGIYNRPPGKLEL